MNNIQKKPCKTQPFANCFEYNGVEHIYTEEAVAKVYLKSAKARDRQNFVVVIDGVEFDFDLTSQMDILYAYVLGVTNMEWKAKDNKFYNIEVSKVVKAIGETKLATFKAYETKLNSFSEPVGSKGL